VLGTEPDVYVSPANGDPFVRECEAGALAACGLDPARCRRLAPALVLGETFGAAGALYVAIACMSLGTGESALVAAVDRNWAGAAAVTGGEDRT